MTRPCGEHRFLFRALPARAGTIVAAASISGSFLGAKVSHGSLDGWAIVALIAFVWRANLKTMGTTAPKPPTPAPPAQLRATPPPGFALPEERGGMFGTKK